MLRSTLRRRRLPRRRSSVSPPAVEEAISGCGERGGERKGAIFACLCVSWSGSTGRLKLPPCKSGGAGCYRQLQWLPGLCSCRIRRQWRAIGTRGKRTDGEQKIQWKSPERCGDIYVLIWGLPGRAEKEDLILCSSEAKQAAKKGIKKERAGCFVSSAGQERGPNLLLLRVLWSLLAGVCVCVCEGEVGGGSWRKKKRKGRRKCSALPLLVFVGVGVGGLA